MRSEVTAIAGALFAGLLLAACQTGEPRHADVPEVTEATMLSAGEVATLIPGNTFDFRSVDGVWTGRVTFEEDGTETGTWRNTRDGESGEIAGPTWSIDGDRKCTTRQGETECYRYARAEDRYLEISAESGDVVTVWTPAG